MGCHDAKEPVAQDYYQDRCFGDMGLRGVLGVMVATMELGERSKEELISTKELILIVFAVAVWRKHWGGRVPLQQLQLC